MNYTGNLLYLQAIDWRKKASGELVLQGLQWGINMNVGDQIWKDIPTVELGV